MRLGARGQTRDYLVNTKIELSTAFYGKSGTRPLTNKRKCQKAFQSRQISVYKRNISKTWNSQ